MYLEAGGLPSATGRSGFVRADPPGLVFSTSSNPMVTEHGLLVTETNRMTATRDSHIDGDPTAGRRRSHTEPSDAAVPVLRQMLRRQLSWKYNWKHINASRKKYAGFLSHFKHEAATEARLVQHSIKEVLDKADKQILFLVSSRAVY